MLSVVLGKVYDMVLIKRIREAIDGVMCEEQCGIR